MTPADLIRDFGKHAGMPAFALDSRGLARLQVDGKLLIDFEHDRDANLLHVFSVIAPAPRDGGESALRALLAANLFLDASGGATIALDPAGAEFIACRRFDADALDAMDGERLARILEAMADTVERMRAQLGELAVQPASVAPVSPATSEPVTFGQRSFGMLRC